MSKEKLYIQKKAANDYCRLMTKIGRQTQVGIVYYSGTNKGCIQPKDKYVDLFRTIVTDESKWRKLEKNGGNKYNWHILTTEEEAYEVFEKLFDVEQLNDALHADTYSDVRALPEEIFKIMERFTSNPEEFDNIRHVPITKNAEIWMKQVGL